ncbi:quinon protein alcohol dehydrogenase-like superfamily [Sphaerosporella brunnea]|uniref:Ribosome assembly protein 4 n=1 Tax=Sphaerosporella brunnea TaxID=1250544 RepID=A0A5J5ELF8_9PEZI|nr:quinon protein alcohol dehydrogenase-like superfamily [Sphaerosporella brunnea]
MSTLLPPKPKRVKREELQRAREQQVPDLVPEDVPNVVVQLRASDTGTQLGGELHIPGNATSQQLDQLVNKLLGTEDDRVPYTFSLLSNPSDPSSAVIDITSDLWTSILKPGHKSTEDVLTLVYTPQAVFRVRAVSRCSAAITGHGNAILSTSFSPASSSRMVSGSGDGTARIWDCNTETPMHTLKGHKNWVLVATWSPDAALIATGSMDNTLRLWDPKSGKPLGDAMKGHSKWITAIAWEPYHLQKPGTPRFASSSKDTTIRVWDATLRRVEVALAGHTAAVTCVKWAGDGRIYSTSQDKTVRIWDPVHGRCLHTLTAHAHWVNHMALSTDFVIRTSFHDHTRNIPATLEEKQQKARERFEQAATIGGEIVERLVTASDDFTMYLWEPAKSTKPIARLLGHQKAVNHVSFSPDGRIIASASFDNSVKLWNARDGKYITTLRGHVAPVYQCAFSADSRLLVSSSKDSTLKVWDVRTGKLHIDLPGHQDEVFAVDWAPDGQKVASGGKDKAVRLWKH